jgi:hypothetical protein
MTPGIEEMKWFATLGVGGILAGMMFFFYRQDRTRTEAALTRLVAERDLVNEQLLIVIQDNTRAITSLSELVRGHFNEEHERETRPPAQRGPRRV